MPLNLVYSASAARVLLLSFVSLPTIYFLSYYLRTRLILLYCSPLNIIVVEVQ